jgi:hypothetical protein
MEWIVHDIWFSFVGLFSLREKARRDVESRRAGWEEGGLFCGVKFDAFRTFDDKRQIAPWRSVEFYVIVCFLFGSETTTCAKLCFDNVVMFVRIG